jgi:hypothetical protein
MTTNRISCCIPGCRRTFKCDADSHETETMCGRHWRMADQHLRDQHKRLMKRHRKVKRLAQRKAILARGEDRIDRVWSAVAKACNSVWSRIQEDVTIKAALGAEDAPKRKPREQPKAQCPTCGEFVNSIFDHINIDCEHP